MAPNHDDDDDDRKDLTRLEDLSEYLHQEDPELENKFGVLSDKEKDSSNEDDSSLISLDELDDSQESESDLLSELPPEIPSDIMNETTFEVQNIEEESPADYSSEMTTDSEISEFSNYEETNLEENNSETFSETLEENNEVFSEQVYEETHSEDLLAESNESEDVFEEATLNETVETTSDFNQVLEPENLDQYKNENFSEVKNFAQNFSYGTIEGAGNPPFSIILKNIKFKEEADDILALLQEFKIVTNSNLKETEHALSMGSLLIPQISEFTAIVLAHKFRRYDLDMEIGLSDAIHPSKSGETNPRGLTNKDSFKQNKLEQIDLSQFKRPLSEMHVTNSTFLPGLKILKHLGIEHTHTLIEAEDLERLTFVYKGLRDGNVDPEDIKYYNSYKEGHEKLHDLLVDELKQKAHQSGANALLSIQFSLNQMNDSKKTYYKLSCTGTKAIVENE